MINRDASKPWLWVIVVGWNDRDDVIRCLTLLHQQTYPHVHIVFVDNGSTDGTVRAVQSHFPQVHLFALNRNYGFAYAVNVAMRYILDRDVDYILLLNTDTYFECYLLDRLVTFMGEHPSVGVASPKIYLRLAPSHLWGVGGILTVGGVRFYGLNECDTGQYDTVHLDFILGCTMLIRAEVIGQLGLLDERYFVYYEEIDFCIRARSAGWQVAFLPHIHLLHDGGDTKPGQSYIRRFHQARSRILFLCKYSMYFNRLVLMLFEVGLTLKIFAIHTYRRDIRSGIAYLHGAIAGLACYNPVVQTYESTESTGRMDHHPQLERCR